MKKWFESKTLWVNLIALVAIVIQGITGKEYLSAESQGVLLTIINMLLRFVTKHEIDWNGEDK